MAIFGGSDTGVDGAIASIITDPSGRVSHIFLRATPTRDREAGGREVAAPELQAQVHQIAPRGWSRWLVERPVRGGMVRQKTGTEFGQGDAHGAVRTVLELAAELTGSPGPEAVMVGAGQWHKQVGMQSAKEAGVERKELSVIEAEKLLTMLVSAGAELQALKPCRGYTGLIGGQSAPRSGAADALLLAWLAYRKWRGVADGAPLLCIDPAWKPEPKPPRARARKPVPENMSQ